ncbi:hypothetical protein D3C81_1762010 [compost metagenome]
MLADSRTEMAESNIRTGMGQARNNIRYQMDEIQRMSDNLFSSQPYAICPAGAFFFCCFFSISRRLLSAGGYRYLAAFYPFFILFHYYACPILLCGGDYLSSGDDPYHARYQPCRTEGERSLSGGRGGAADGIDL